MYFCHESKYEIEASDFSSEMLLGPGRALPHKSKPRLNEALVIP